MDKFIDVVGVNVERVAQGECDVNVPLRDKICDAVTGAMLGGLRIIRVFLVSFDVMESGF